jgi:hypothetical protein
VTVERARQVDAMDLPDLTERARKSPRPRSCRARRASLLDAPDELGRRAPHWWRVCLRAPGRCCRLPPGACGAHRPTLLGGRGDGLSLESADGARGDREWAPSGKGTRGRAVQPLYLTTRPERTSEARGVANLRYKLESRTRVANTVG